MGRSRTTWRDVWRQVSSRATAKAELDVLSGQFLKHDADGRAWVHAAEHRPITSDRSVLSKELSMLLGGHSARSHW